MEAVPKNETPDAGYTGRVREQTKQAEANDRSILVRGKDLSKHSGAPR